MPNHFFKYIFLIVLTLGLVVSPTAQAQEVMIVQSGSIKPYQHAVRSYQQTLAANITNRGIKSIHPAHSETILLGKNSKHENISKKYNTLQPDLILAVGSKALKAVTNLPVPIIYLMVSQPDPIVHGKSNITGINMTVAPEKQLAEISKHFPDLRNVGVLYGGKSASTIQQAIRFTQANNLSITTKQCANPKDISAHLKELQGTIDSLWLLPDPAILTPTTLDLFTIYSINNKIPLIAFAPKYLRHGAAMAIFASPESMGEQAARMTLRILAGESIEQNRPENSKHAITKANLRVIKKLGVTYKETIPASKERNP